MKKIIICISILSLFIGRLTADTATEQARMTSIILINGEPHLVDMNLQGEVIVSLGIVPSYFSSTMSNEEIVNQAIIEYSGDQESKVFLEMELDEIVQSPIDENTVDLIREIAVRAEREPKSEVVLSISSSDHNNAPYMDDQIDRFKNLLIDFGVPQNRIRVDAHPFIIISEPRFIRLEVLQDL